MNSVEIREYRILGSRVFILRLIRCYLLYFNIQKQRNFTDVERMLEFLEGVFFD